MDKRKPAAECAVIPIERITRAILLIRGQKAMLDEALAALYGVEVKVLNQAVKRNADRFPADFMFQLTKDEAGAPRRHLGTSRSGADALRSQTVTSKTRGGRRYPPYAFTEQGVAMLSSVLNSPLAIQVNIQIMRAFVAVKRMGLTYLALKKKIQEMEKKYDVKFRVVFEAIEQQRLLERVNSASPVIFERLERLKMRAPVISEVRGRGFLIGIELTADGRPVVEACRARRLLINCTQERVLRLLPALTITRSQLERALAILEEVLTQQAAHRPAPTAHLGA